MPQFDSMLQNERRLRAFTGLDTATFSDFLPQFTLAMERYLQHTTLDGYRQTTIYRTIRYSSRPAPARSGSRLGSIVPADHSPTMTFPFSGPASVSR
jgi:hypothetical protein